MLHRKLLTRFMPIVFGAAVLSGCNQEVPGCASEVATGLLMEILNKQANQWAEFWSMALEVEDDADQEPGIEYEIEAIRTQNTNPQTGAHECAAELHVAFEGERLFTFPINYSVEKTDDGKQLYVTLKD